MGTVSIKTVVIWGILIFLTDILLVSVIMALMSIKGNFFLISGPLGLVISAGLAYKSAKSLTEGLLEGVAATVLGLLLNVFQVNSAFIINVSILIIGALLGGFLASKKITLPA